MAKDIDTFDPDDDYVPNQHLILLVPNATAQQARNAIIARWGGHARQLTPFRVGPLNGDPFTHWAAIAFVGQKVVDWLEANKGAVNGEIIYLNDYHWCSSLTARGLRPSDNDYSEPS